MKLPFHTNTLALTAGLAALQDRDYIEESISMTLAERERLYDALDEMSGLQVYPSQANFLLFKSEQDSNQLSDALQQRGSIVRPLDRFYMPGYLRVSVGQPDENARFSENLGSLLNQSAS